MARTRGSRTIMARTRGSRTTPSHNTPFQPGHPLKFGVEAAMLDTNGVVIAAGCKFCRCFGRETAPEGQRKRTKNTKFFRVPFRPQNYKAHLTSAHPEKWAQYDALPEARKVLYFPDGDVFTAVVVPATSVKGEVSEENTMAVQPVEVPRTAPERNVAQIPMHPEVVTTGNANEIALPETHVDGRQNNHAEGKRKMKIFTADDHAPDETETKRRKLKESSDYVQSLFRTVGEMRAAGCNELLVTKMLEEAERQAFNLVRESKLQLP